MLHEYPLQNFDDAGGITSVARLAWDVARRQEAGETIWEVVQAGQPIGVVGYASISSEVAALHGICFLSSVHGTGIPLAAVQMAFETIFAQGHDLIFAGHFADNIPIQKFLAKLGAVEHHGNSHEVARCGKMVPVRIVTVKASDFFAMRRRVA